MQNEEEQTSLQNEEINKIENEKSNDSVQKENSARKKNIASNVLLIIGIILFCVGLIFAIIFMDTFIDYVLAKEGEKLATAIGLVAMFAYFGFPCLIISAVSSILNILSYSLSAKRKTLKLVFMILSILTTVLSAILIILLYVI